MNAPWNTSAYLVTISGPHPDDLAAASHRLFDLVWRPTLDCPGFALVRFAEPVDSHTLRRVMLDLVAGLPVEFVPERFGRFDQQVSSKFHRDGAPPASLLLLGYEPTTVRSRLFIADSSLAATAAGVPLPEFLAKFNPMFPVGEAKYLPFVTELELPHGESFVVAINNSQLPVGDGNPLGVLHKALIEHPDPAARRVINSVGLAPLGWHAVKSAAEIEHFLTRRDLD